MEKNSKHALIYNYETNSTLWNNVLQEFSEKNPRSHTIHFASYKHDTKLDLNNKAAPGTDDFMKSYEKYLDTLETCKALKKYSYLYNSRNVYPAVLIYTEKIENPNSKGIYSVECSARFSWSFLDSFLNKLSI